MMKTPTHSPAAAEFQAKVEEEIAQAAQNGRPIDRQQAVRRVHQKFPELHAALLDEMEEQSRTRR